jgi:hypothetical protein
VIDTRLTRDFSRSLGFHLGSGRVLGFLVRFVDGQSAFDKVRGTVKVSSALLVVKLEGAPLAHLRTSLVGRRVVACVGR